MLTYLTFITLTTGTEFGLYNYFPGSMVDRFVSQLKMKFQTLKQALPEFKKSMLNFINLYFFGINCFKNNQIGMIQFVLFLKPNFKRFVCKF